MLAHKMVTFPFSLYIEDGRTNLIFIDDTQTTLHLFLWFCFDGGSLFLGLCTKRKTVCLCSGSLFNCVMPFKSPVVYKGRKRLVYLEAVHANSFFMVSLI